MQQAPTTAGQLVVGNSGRTNRSGYAFLKLHCRTRDPIWIERARAFATTAISQCQAKRNKCARYSLKDGDVGLAVFCEVPPAWQLHRAYSERGARLHPECNGSASALRDY